MFNNCSTLSLKESKLTKSIIKVWDFQSQHNNRRKKNSDLFVIQTITLQVL